LAYWTILEEPTPGTETSLAFQLQGKGAGMLVDATTSLLRVGCGKPTSFNNFTPYFSYTPLGLNS
jgi:hypothetical protein